MYVLSNPMNQKCPNYNGSQLLTRMDINWFAFKILRHKVSLSQVSTNSHQLNYSYLILQEKVKKKNAVKQENCVCSSSYLLKPKGSEKHEGSVPTGISLAKLQRNCCWLSTFLLMIDQLVLFFNEKQWFWFNLKKEAQN